MMTIIVLSTLAVLLAITLGALIPYEIGVIDVLLESMLTGEDVNIQWLPFTLLQITVVAVAGLLAFDVYTFVICL